MQNRLAARADFESDIYNDPIKLLIAIKEHSLNYQESCYEMSIILDSLCTMINLRQHQKENLQDYTRRFKTSQDILESHIGGLITLTKYVKTMAGYDENNSDVVITLTKEAGEQFNAFLYLENADQAKYGSLLKNLNSQKSLGND